MKSYRGRRFGNKAEEKSEQNVEIENTSTSARPQPAPYESKELTFTPNQRISFKRGVKRNEENTPRDDKNNNKKTSMSNNIHKAKSRQIEENKEISDFETNKKFRNTITGLNTDKMKYQSGLIDMIIRIEKDNVNHYLRGDLAEMYKDINRDNYDFKNDVFFANVDHFEKKTGDLDGKQYIPYNCSEDISFKLGTYPRTNEIIDKFAERSKTFQQSD
jgi:hypothetical protein